MIKRKRGSGLRKKRRARPKVFLVLLGAKIGPSKEKRTGKVVCINPQGKKALESILNPRF